jgi:hypothetical protein
MLAGLIVEAKGGGIKRAPLTLRAGLRRKEVSCFFAYPAFTPAARVARLRPCGANFSSRLRRWATYYNPTFATLIHCAWSFEASVYFAKLPSNFA